MLQQAQQAFSQMGDLSGIAGGQAGQLSPEMLAAIQQSQVGARAGIEQNFQQGMADQQVAASTRGIGGSSAEAIGAALLGQGRSNQLAGLDAQAAQAQLSLPQQLQQLQLQANAQLAQFGGGLLGQNVGIYSQERLGSGTTSGTTQTSGMTMGEALGGLSSLGQSAATFGSSTPGSGTP